LRRKEDLVSIREKMDNLREQLNDDISKNIESGRNNGNEALLARSRELDDVINEYIKNHL
jgi:hypothetical protein